VRGDRDGSTLATVKRSQAIAIDFALRERLTMVFMPSTGSDLGTRVSSVASSESSVRIGGGSLD
jgi:hypothetical protein